MELDKAISLNVKASLLNGKVAIVTSEEERDSPKRRIGLPILAYVTTLLGAIAVIKAWSPTGVLRAAIIAFPVAALAWMIVSSSRAQRACGPASPAQRAYMRRFFPLMIGYALLLLGAVWLGKQYHPTGPAAVVLAILPSLPLIGVVWAMGRLIVDESDEYQRSLNIRQILIATGFMLSVTSVWGFLESSGEVPHLPMYWSFIVWCFGLAVGSLVNELSQ
jgi:heme A synthase